MTIVETAVCLYGKMYVREELGKKTPFFEFSVCTMLNITCGVHPCPKPV